MMSARRRGFDILMTVGRRTRRDAGNGGLFRGQPPAFERFEQARLFAADVSAGHRVLMHSSLYWLPTCRLAKIPLSYAPDGAFIIFAWRWNSPRMK